ncbi:SDR family NAD(P)-dependent oxidoreductase [Methylobacterium trifolii]|uniref:2,5-dichloro-2,5-cyclohexadiene-1,4-diol dehydrogenase LinX n=1 Tax=Methylobacterium trifolii TaxID=1003092 RepID=A0ABQ4TZ29_9HYPH|nr:SDR family NAD(P)-dependent oxidoreductase [Methylobacterium trifolii]GJE60466.1 2,5-dichloro-2,5-cyclohexadiene-1,4-diol dehydrogenase LinX [Methylobacterium trifolii]
MDGRLAGKVAIVSGAGAIGPGLSNGRATAILYAREGAQVFATDLDPDSLAETQSIVEAEGGRCTTQVADASSAEAVCAYVERCIDLFGRVDILQNNVGIVDVGGPEELTEGQWDKLFAVNVKSMFLSCKYVLPRMVERGRGVIVNISSIASIRYTGYPCASYAASKAAVNQLTQNIAIQYADKGIRANCVLPGLMDTPQIRHYVQSGYGNDPDAMIKTRNRSCPTGQMGTPWDVAAASLFLASDEARYVTGSLLVVDGGLTSRSC